MRRSIVSSLLWCLNCVNGLCSGRPSAAFTCLVCVVLTVPVRAEVAWISGFTDRVLHQGHEALLPPHLALVLGLGGGEKAVAMKQLGTQSAQEVRTFNVRTEKGRTVVVILRYDRKTQVTQAFLLGRGTKLRRAVTYEAGAQPTSLSDESARVAFQEELQYWSSQAAVP
jgi:hypothetical protein